jgi:hypothetical protein
LGKSRNCGAKAPLFQWLRGAQTIWFQGGEMELGQPLAAPFWFLAAIGGFW